MYGAGYQEQRPDTWEAYLMSELNQKLVPFTDFMDHVVRLSTDAYAGTARADDFAIFHDGLSAWWEAGARGILARRRSQNRSIFEGQRMD
jgi:hypothetical protein